jgi:hypothetical protein
MMIWGAIALPKESDRTWEQILSSAMLIRVAIAFSIQITVDGIR